MKREDIIRDIEVDVIHELGYILEQNKDGILYYDYENGTETFYRYEESCTIDWLKSRIFIGESIKNKGLTIDFVANMLYETFKDCFADAICTLNSILIFSNEEELNKSLMFAAPNEYEEVIEHEEHIMEHFEDVCGKMWFRMQTLMICESTIRNTSFDIANQFVNEKYDKDYYNEVLNEEYSRGIISTIIHECRHCMLDTNLFLSMEDFPICLASEDNVEKFCRNAYDNLPLKYKKLPYSLNNY